MTGSVEINYGSYHTMPMYCDNEED